jgi:hypothetical protein
LQEILGEEAKERVWSSKTEEEKEAWEDATDHERLAMGFDKPGVPLPSMIVASLSLLRQWQTDISRVSKKFRFTTYHGDEAQLFNTNAIFAGIDKKMRWEIILTTPETLRARHGPEATVRARVAAGTTFAQADRARLLEPRDLPLWLSGKLWWVIYDEAHFMKNPESSINRTCRWVHPRFSLIVTATPIFNGIPDLEGYARVMQANQAWDPQRLRNVGLNEATNPFALPEDHPEYANLLVSRYAVHQFITLNKDPGRQAQYAHQFLKLVMMRRGYGSQMPGAPDGTTIGEGVKKIKRKRLVCYGTQQEAAEFGRCVAHASKSLFSSKTKRGRKIIVWNNARLRELLMASSSTLLWYAQERLMAKNCGWWRSQDNPLYELLRAIHEAMTEARPPGHGPGHLHRRPQAPPHPATDYSEALHAEPEVVHLRSPPCEPDPHLCGLPVCRNPGGLVHRRHGAGRARGGHRQLQLRSAPGSRVYLQLPNRRCRPQPPARLPQRRLL